MCEAGQWRNAEYLRRNQNDPDFDGTCAVIRLAASEGWFDPCQDAMTKSLDPATRSRYLIEAMRSLMNLPAEQSNRRFAVSNWTLYHERMRDHIR